MRHLLWLKTLLVIAFLLILGASGSVEAAGFFSVRPAKNEIWLEAGEQKTASLQITNQLGYDSWFDLVIQDFKWSPTGVDFKETSNVALPSSLTPFLNLETTEVFIPAGGKIDLPVKISVPVGTGPASFWSAITVTPRSNLALVGVTKVNTQINSLWFLRIKGEAKEQGSLVGFGRLPSQPNSDKAEFFLAYKNEGNVYLTPYGVLHLKNWWGREIKSWRVDPWFVLPGSERSRVVSVNLGSTWGWYKMELELNRGYQDLVDKKTISFWVGSGLVWLALLLGILLIIGLVIFVVKLKR